MHPARIRSRVAILVSLFIESGCATVSRSGGGGLPTCFNVGTCAPSAYRDSLEFGAAARTLTQRAGCKAPPLKPSFAGPTVVSDFSDGLSSDGRGPYAPGTDGVLGAGIDIAATLALGVPDSVDVVRPRKLVLNLNHPLANGGGIPLGMITLGDNKLPQWAALYTQWRIVDNASQNLHDVAVGQTVTALQMNVWFYINGQFHMLQMGQQPWGHCHVGTNLVTGTGTSSATIYRTSATKWVVDLPAGSVGRLFDLHNTAAHAVDRGLYNVRLHYEMGY